MKFSPSLELMTIVLRAFTGPIAPSGAMSYRLVDLVRDSDFDFDFADRQRYYIAPSFTIGPNGFPFAWRNISHKGRCFVANHLI